VRLNRLGPRHRLRGEGGPGPAVSHPAGRL